MKVKWIGLVAVALVAGLIIAYKQRAPQGTAATDAHRLPRVLLVADLSEADSGGDPCAEIIRSVRAARARGVAVQELNHDSQSDLIRRYRVLTVPTVLILDSSGEVVSRLEGEGREAVAAVRTQLEQLR